MKSTSGLVSLALLCLLPAFAPAQDAPATNQPAVQTQAAAVTAVPAPPGRSEDLPEISYLNGECYTVMNQSWKSNDQRGMSQLLQADSNAGCLVNLILAVTKSHIPNTLTEDLTNLLAAVSDKQSGGSVGTAGSTSVISKNLTSSLLSVADNYGALTSTTSGQTITVSGSLDQIPIAIEEHGHVLPECAVQLTPNQACIKSGLMSFLGKISYSASLDTSQSSSASGTATGAAVNGAQQVTGTQGGNSLGLTQFTAKILAWHTNPAISDITLPQLSTSSAETYRQTLLCFERGLKSSAEISTVKGSAKSCLNIPGSVRTSNWLTAVKEVTDKLLAASADNFPTVLEQQIPVLVQGLESVNVTESDIYPIALSYAAAIVGENGQARSAWDTAIWKKPILTFEYDYNTPSNQPSNSTYRLIYGQSVAGWKLTVNGAGSTYNSQPSSSIPNASRLRDWQVGAEIDHNLPKIGLLDSSTFSLDTYFQDQTSPAILNVTPGSPVTGVSFTGLSSNASQIYGQTGLIGLGQIKITLATSKGFSFPFTVSGSNQSELLTNTKPLFGAQIGISFDFDSAVGK